MLPKGSVLVQVGINIEQHITRNIRIARGVAGLGEFRAAGTAMFFIENELRRLSNVEGRIGSTRFGEIPEINATAELAESLGKTLDSLMNKKIPRKQLQIILKDLDKNFERMESNMVKLHNMELREKVR